MDHQKLVLEALFDIHEMSPRTSEGSDDAWEFKARARPVLEEFERRLRASATLDRTTFLHVWSWTFYIAQAGVILTLKHPDNGRSLGMRMDPVEAGHRKVFFSANQSYKSPDEAAAVVWDFLMGLPVPESWR